ncbi:MAG: 2-amino-4-hydroxy-6-hydroxymethyldihydropteridine diphosphokinase [Chloroflexi bacterium RBG_16_57_9]|nr:MAG: 2-amino-4-hydroxy-6-hydroxymethyldihydropteridine diphosphokinase [Chloroflexi bacterium RBG_16_57_9]
MSYVHRVYLGLGSNLGDRAGHLKKALQCLERQVHLTAVSSIYETEPWGLKDQPYFLNLVAVGDTDLSPVDLLAFVKSIEQEMGRRPTIRYGPRLIDIDILFYDDQVIHLPGLQIPHPRLPERAFVLEPLAEVSPDLVHPVLGLSITELLARIQIPMTNDQ